MARQDVLKILFDSLEDKTPVYASKRVSSVRDLGDLAMVEAADGDSFTCDLVAGADGVRSIVREAIHAQTASPPLNCTQTNSQSNNDLLTSSRPASLNHMCLWHVQPPPPDYGRSVLRYL